LWILFTVHITISTVVTDACVEIDLMIDSPTPSPISMLMNCAENNTAFEPIKGVIEATLSDVERGTCNKTIELCATNFTVCSNDVSTNCSIEVLQDDFLDSFIEDVVFDCSVGGNPTTVEDPSVCDLSPSPVVVNQTVTIRTCPEVCRNTQIKK
jgi:hypothetical protein